MRRLEIILVSLLVAGFGALERPVPANDVPAGAPGEDDAHFETRIRPLLSERCFGCHGPERQEADLRLDQRDAVLAGEGGTVSPEGIGPVVVPGQPDQSRLIQVIRYSDSDVQMPPTGKLPEGTIALLTDWVRGGAHWPAAATPPAAAPAPRTPSGEVDVRAVAASHWAYRPVTRRNPPAVSHPERTVGEIDRFVLAALEQRGLTLSPEADRRTLIRRASFDLLGIPPGYAEVEAFCRDRQPDAYERLIDRLLASPLYGERWARHWLDVARYADTKGYVFTENRFYPWSSTYRDYVISSLNADKPYDRFVLEQLAADLLGLPDRDPALAALGFLTVGRRFLNSEHDIIDDRIDVVGRGLLGMTLTCARCHDHKYDPISSEDYYSLYGVFASCYEPEVGPLLGDEPATAEYRAYVAELQTRQQAVADYRQQVHTEMLALARAHAGDYLLAAAQRARLLPAEGEVAFAHGAPRDRLIELWTEYLSARIRPEDPVLGPLARLRSDPSALPLPAEALSALNPLVRDRLKAEQPATAEELLRVYGRLLEEVDEQGRTAPAEGADPDGDADPARAALRQILTGPGSVSDVPLEDTERRLFGRDHRDELRRRARKVAEWEVSAPGAPPRAMVLLDKAEPVQGVVFVRGNPDRRGASVPRRFPRVLSEVAGEFDQGSGRLELARAIVSPQNPLTARVLVNRIWLGHFGRALVDSPSDFGLRTGPGAHAELLDWLAWTLVHVDGWSLKALHRRIMLSATYRQASRAEGDGLREDPENRLLWRRNLRRLEFEPMRDALLAVSGRLDLALGGRPVDIELQPASGRRSVYALIDRNNFPSLFRTFDLPSPDVSSAGRPVTTVPQQALYQMNGRFVQELADQLALAAGHESQTADTQIDWAYRRVLARDPVPDERALAARYLNEADGRLAELLHALLMTNEFLHVD
jgi:hypothetical protein